MFLIGGGAFLQIVFQPPDNAFSSLDLLWRTRPDVARDI